MMKNDLYRQSLMPSHEVYLPYVLSVCYKASRLVGNTETVKWQMLLWHLSVSSKTFTSCQASYIFWLSFWTIFKR